MEKRSDLELGVTHWMHHHMQMALEKQLYKLNLRSQAGLDDFLKVTNTDEAELNELGKRIRSGAAQHLSPIYNHVSISTFQGMDYEWSAIDSTIPQSAEDTNSRYSNFYNWDGNSCGWDAVLAAAIQLDLGRLKIDQVTWEHAIEKETPAIVRTIVCSAWGLHTEKQREELRDLFMEVSCNESTSLKPNSFSDVNDILAVSVSGFPQCSMIVSAKVCCAAKLPETRSSVLDIINSISTNPKGCLQGVMEGRHKAIEKCSSQGCKGNPQGFRFVLDRPSPTLIISTNGKFTKDSDSCNYLVQFSYHFLGFEKHWDVTYSPVGALFYVATTEGGSLNHFILRWKRSNQIVELDPLRAAETQLREDWWAGLKESSRLLVVFYRATSWFEMIH